MIALIILSLFTGLASVSADTSAEEVIAAVESCDLERLSELLEDVDNINTIIGDDVPILVMAEEAAGINGYENPVTALLVEKGAYILQRDERGRDFEKVIQDFEVAATPRHMYIIDTIGDKKKRYWQAVRDDSVDGIKELLEYLPIDNNLLLDAAHQKSAEIVSWALSNGVSVHAANSKGATVLHMACDKYTHKSFEERTGLIRTVLEAGADPLAVDSKGATPLIYLMDAAQMTSGNMTEAVSLLLSCGADPNVSDSSGRSALQLALERNQQDSIRVLLDYGAKPELPSGIISGLKPEMVTGFISHGGKPAAFFPAIAAYDNDVQAKLVYYMIFAGASAADLDLVCVANNTPLIKYLVERGADINGSDIMKSFALNYPGPDILEYLLGHGADVNKKFYLEQNALHLAARKNNLDSARFFVEQGVDINATDSRNRTPLDYCQAKDGELYNYLVESGAKKAAELQ